MKGSYGIKKLYGGAGKGYGGGRRICLSEKETEEFGFLLVSPTLFSFQSTTSLFHKCHHNILFFYISNN